MNNNCEILQGDCLEVLKAMPDCSIDSIVTDPPYGLSFMGKKWDYDVPAVEVWAECLRVLKPGGHLLCFAGTRTQHRMAVRIEDAGFEIRDLIMWCYGSGFPKSHNLQGEWQGWGTALKPALEPITVARKPFQTTVAANVLEYGTGALNVDGCRVGTDDNLNGGAYSGSKRQRDEYSSTDSIPGAVAMSRLNRGIGQYEQPQGRWPANLIHDGSDEVVGLFPTNVKGAVGMKRVAGQKSIFNLESQTKPQRFDGAIQDTGSASRFFYCAKASKKDRDEGCEGLEERGNNRYGDFAGTPDHAKKTLEHNKSRNHHPTVKPTDLMRYLCRLVTPPSGTVLDPYAGSGSTGKAIILEGFNGILIERESEYIEIINARIEHAKQMRDESTRQPELLLS